MSEVLSQSQIDELLASVQGGGGVTEKEAEGTSDKKYRKYDFYSPKKFTKDKLNIIRSTHDNYCRIATSRLNSLLRTASDVTMLTVEEERYYEFSNALSDKDALTLIRARIKDSDSADSTVFMHITTPLMLSMIDRMLGGTGENIADVSSSYGYTDIELQLYENIARYLVGIMKDAWSNYLDITFDLTKVETSHGLLQEIGMDEIVVIVVLNVAVNNIEGKINICIPSTLLTNIFSVIEGKKMPHGRAPNGEDRTSQGIFNSIKDSTLEVSAKIGDAMIMLQDVYDLQVNDIINLGRSKDSHVDIFVEDKMWFRGKLGIQNKNIAVKISDTEKNR